VFEKSEELGDGKNMAWYAEGILMNEIYAYIASGLRDAGLPASTFLVEQYLGRNDFKGLIALLREAKEKCSLTSMIALSCRGEV